MGMQAAALCADISGASAACQEIKAEKIIFRLPGTAALKISAQIATVCIPTRSMGTRKSRQGRQRIARQFIAGLEDTNTLQVPLGTTETVQILSY
ncbi:MAG: hypothetical protein GY749_09635 [Desulfobacteraceae bacterium]|nr:hypothetical protein [Desulfobacteraceae bacterium]